MDLEVQVANEIDDEGLVSACDDRAKEARCLDANLERSAERDGHVLQNVTTTLEREVIRRE